jgi:predicted nuclease with TOPRIM domain
MAQDFYASFGLGEDEKTISTIDPAGVALAAIQELYKTSVEQRAISDELRAENKELITKNEELSKRLAELESIVKSLVVESKQTKEQLIGELK